MVNPGYPYQQPYTYAPPPPGNGFAVAGMVLGICALVFCWFPFVNWILALLGIIFSILGLTKAKKVEGRGKGMAIAGLICGILGALMGVMIVLLFVAGVRKVGRELEKTGNRAVAHSEVQEYAFEAYPKWSVEHADKECPDSLKELDKYLTLPSATDPWGHPYKMMCGQNLPAGATGIAILSMGPDGEEGTSDDIKSWQ
jgi:hypothetical protein